MSDETKTPEQIISERLIISANLTLPWALKYAKQVHLDLIAAGYQITKSPQQPAAIPDTLPEDDMRYLTAKELGIHPSRITAIDGKSITISSQPSPQTNEVQP